jgi:hypothetical protein
MNDVRAEIQRQHSDTEETLALFRSSPMAWISWRTVAKISPCAWRTRISNCRALFRAEHRLPKSVDPLPWNGNTRESCYRYVPFKALGPPADVPRAQTLFQMGRNF